MGGYCLSNLKPKALTRSYSSLLKLKYCYYWQHAMSSLGNIKTGTREQIALFLGKRIKCIVAFELFRATKLLLFRLRSYNCSSDFLRQILLLKSLD